MSGEESPAILVFAKSKYDTRNRKNTREGHRAKKLAYCPLLTLNHQNAKAGGSSMPLCKQQPIRHLSLPSSAQAAPTHGPGEAADEQPDCCPEEAPHRHPSISIRPTRPRRRSTPISLPRPRLIILRAA